MIFSLRLSKNSLTPITDFFCDVLLSFHQKFLNGPTFATILGAKFIIFNTKKSLSLFQKCGAIINDKKEKSLQSLDKKLTFPIQQNILVNILKTVTGLLQLMSIYLS